MFCPKCGDKKVVDVFCAKCLKEERPLVSSFKEFKAEVCSTCGRIDFRGRRHETEDVTGRLGELFRELVVHPNYAEIQEVRIRLPPFERKPGLKVQDEASVTVTGRASPEAKFYDEEYLVPFEVLHRHCPRCAKIGTQYFEGTLQVRNENEETKRFVLDAVKRSGANVTKSVKERNGTDYYLTSNGAVERVARALQERFGGAVKSSAHLHGHDNLRSKDLYRATWFVELPPFAPGDVLKKEKSVLLVRELGKRIRFYSLQRGKTEFHEYRPGAFHRLPVMETSIATTHPSLMVIHPETFQQTKVENQKLNPHEPGERVSVCIDEKGLYLVEVVK